MGRAQGTENDEEGRLSFAEAAPGPLGPQRECVCCALLLQFCPTLCDPVDCMKPLSIGFSRQESWSGLPCPPPGDLPEPGTEPAFSRISCIADGFFTPEPPEKAPSQGIAVLKGLG